mgnify:FL=1
MKYLYSGDNIKKVIDLMNKHQKSDNVEDQEINSLDFLYKLTEIEFK